MLIIFKIRITYNYIFIIISIVGIIYLGGACLRQYDIKILVAYSSVVHISLILIGIMTITVYGKIGSFILIIGHGFCSSGIFLIVNYFYIRSQRRRILINKGLLSYFPSIIL